MSGTSNISRVVPLRLPNDVADIWERRARKQGLTIGEYLRTLLVAEAYRDRNAPRTKRKGAK